MMSRLSSRLSFLALVCGLGVACGGAVEQPDPSLTTPSELSSTNGPWGRWQLVELTSSDTPTRTFGQLEIEAVPGGMAYARKCLAPHFEAGAGHLRCADANSYDCLDGKLEWDGAQWRFAFPSFVTQGFPARGEIVQSAEGDLLVKNALGTSATGRFTRVSNERRFECAPKK